MQNHCSWLGIGVELPSVLSQQCNKLNTEITLINPRSYKFSQENRPHLNLYDLDLPETNVPDIISALNNVLSNMSSFEVRILKIGYFNFGAIFLEVEKHPLLINLHTAVVDTVYKYKGNCVCTDYSQPWRKYTREQAEMLEKYGSPFVMNEFQPHISVGFIKAPEEMLKTHVENLNKIMNVGSFRIENVSLVDDEEKGHNTLITINLK
jgi:2'-5' RNA ligase